MAPSVRLSARTLIHANTVTLIAAPKTPSDIALDIFDRKDAEKTASRGGNG